MRIYIANCHTTTERVLADIRRILESQRPDLVAEYDTIDRSVMTGPAFAYWLNEVLGMDINPATQSIMDLPWKIAHYLGMKNFTPDWDIGGPDDDAT